MTNTQILTSFRSSLSFALAIACTVGCLTLTGCDLGTYSKRLNEKNVVTQPSGDTEADDTKAEESE